VLKNNAFFFTMIALVTLYQKDWFTLLKNKEGGHSQKEEKNQSP